MRMTKLTVTFPTALMQTTMAFWVATSREITVLRERLTERYPDADIHVDFQTIDEIMTVDAIMDTIADEMREHASIATGGGQ